MMEHHKNGDTATAACAPGSQQEAPCRHTLHIPGAGSGWGLVLQSGVLVPAVTGISLQLLLEREFAVPPALLSQIDVLLLEGKPVDEPAKALVPDAARIALAAGLPGIAGLAMKSGSAVRGLRPGITHGTAAGGPPPPERPGHVEVVLFSLALPLLAPHFLARGVIAPAGRLVPYLRPAITPECLLDGVHLDPDQGRERLASLPGHTPVLVTAAFDG